MGKLDKLQSFLSNNLLYNSTCNTNTLDTFDSYYIGGIVGGYKPSSYSQSPVLWNTYFRLNQIKGIFFPFDLMDKEKLKSFLFIVLNTPGFLDLTITDPYKKNAFVELNYIVKNVNFSEQAQNLKVINHIIINPKNKSIKALNTDGLGMIQAIKKRIDLKDKKVMLIGAGGAAKSIGYELIKNGSNLFIVNRTVEKAEGLSDFLNKFVISSSQSVNWGSLYDIKAHSTYCDLIVNTISGKLSTDLLEGIANDTLLAESTYGNKSSLSLIAEKYGNPYIGGKEMLLRQFIEAVREIFPILAISEDKNEKSLSFIENKFLDNSR